MPFITKDTSKAKKKVAYREKAVGKEKTKGGTYPKYKKGGRAGKSFGAAFKANCAGKGSGSTFTWNGRSYSCAKAGDKKKKPAAKAAPKAAPKAANKTALKAKLASQRKKQSAAEKRMHEAEKRVGRKKKKPSWWSTTGKARWKRLTSK